jgi:predicted nucleic acid-binding protein
VERARDVLQGIALVPIDDAILREAADLSPVSLRTLDAIHVATALSLAPDVTTLVTYDGRLAEAAAAGISIVAPGTDESPRPEDPQGAPDNRA